MHFYIHDWRYYFEAVQLDGYPNLAFAEDEKPSKDANGELPEVSVEPRSKGVFG